MSNYRIEQKDSIYKILNSIDILNYNFKDFYKLIERIEEENEKGYIFEGEYNSKYIESDFQKLENILNEVIEEMKELKKYKNFLQKENKKVKDNL
jgi:hypothetical protein